MARTEFKNFKAFKKALKTFRNEELIKAGTTPYSKASRIIQAKARKNAPVRKTGKLRDNIRRTRVAKRRLSRGSILNYTVYSNSIQDMLITHGVPKARISGNELTKRSRTFRGKRYRPKPSGDFSKGDERRAQYYKRNWAWGKRDPNPFMTKGQDFEKILTDMANETADNIFKQFDKKFSALAK